jgi:ubiquinol oxidase
LELKFFWLPQVIAFGYYQFSWLLSVVNPKWSYGLNADFEDHAEHEYMQWVADNPQSETEPFDSDFAEEYGVFESIADLFRQIGHDERVRKEESIAAMDSHGSNRAVPAICRRPRRTRRCQLRMPPSSSTRGGVLVCQ